MLPPLGLAPKGKGHHGRKLVATVLIVLILANGGHILYLIFSMATQHFPPIRPTKYRAMCKLDISLAYRFSILERYREAKVSLYLNFIL